MIQHEFVCAYMRVAAALSLSRIKFTCVLEEEPVNCTTFCWLGSLLLAFVFCSVVNYHQPHTRAHIMFYLSPSHLLTSLFVLRFSQVAFSLFILAHLEAAKTEWSKRESSLLCVDTVAHYTHQNVFQRDRERK